MNTRLTLIALAAFFVGVTSGTAATPILPTCCPPLSGAIAWYPAENNANDVIGGNDGSWIGNEAYTTGICGSAFSFDGSSFVSVPAGSGALDITGNQVTIMGWIYPTAFGKNAIYFGKTAYGFNDYVLLNDFADPNNPNTTPGQLVALVKTCAGFANCEHLFGGFAPFVVPANRWTHIALTYDGNTATIYVNGTAIGSTAFSGNISGEGSQFAIGGRSSDPFVDHHMIGSIDEVQVFNRALGPDEILATYRCGAPAPPSACSIATSITANFNGTKINANSYIWFNSVMKPSGLGSQPVTFRFTNQTISSSAFTVPVPDASVTFDPNATTATTTFSGGMWVTTVPSSGLSGNTFLSGVPFMVPSTLPGGIKNVTWTGTISPSVPNVTMQWQWAAAVYPNFSSDPNSLGVKPVDDNKASQYKNSDHAGTPENYKTQPESSRSNVVGGATGGGGSNYTGSYSGTEKAGPCPPGE